MVITSVCFNTYSRRLRYSDIIGRQTRLSRHDDFNFNLESEKRSAVAEDLEINAIQIDCL